jgi:hypothetical protein
MEPTPQPRAVRISASVANSMGFSTPGSLPALTSFRLVIAANQQGHQALVAIARPGF